MFVGLLFVLASEVYAADNAAVDSGSKEPEAYLVTAISGSQAGDDYVVRIQGTMPPTYTLYELFEPKPRVVVDIADAAIDETAGLPLQLSGGPVSRISGSLLVDEDAELVRLEMFLSGEANYSAVREENDIVVTFAGWSREEELFPESSSRDLASVADADSAEESPDDVKAAGEEGPTPDSFAFAGYTKQPVTVDFYKIDLHNVFRLFGEISGLNIVVDEGVKGSLTLSLNNVPWDFALDIILNLKDLQKEERFNTIVISPQSKDFVWPEGPADTIAFKAGEGPLFIEKQVEIPEEVVEAQKLMRKARAAEKKENYEKALAMYEEAFKMWPENSDIANRLSTLCLVQLGMNAKAVYYAKQALNIDPLDKNASLNAAIALANMQRNSAALEYFEQAADGDDAPKEALFSYAMFAENNSDYITALLLLARHEKLYGDTLETMVAKARIYDKEGNVDRAAQEYKSILLSGFDIPPDLRRYVRGRVVLSD
jgi:type IV pilus assembly protein PilQ